MSSPSCGGRSYEWCAFPVLAVGRDAGGLGPCARAPLPSLRRPAARHGCAAWLRSTKLHTWRSWRSDRGHASVLQEAPYLSSPRFLATSRRGERRPLHDGQAAFLVAARLGPAAPPPRRTCGSFLLGPMSPRESSTPPAPCSPRAPALPALALPPTLRLLLPPGAGVVVLPAHRCAPGPFAGFISLPDAGAPLRAPTGTVSQTWDALQGSRASRCVRILASSLPRRSPLRRPPPLPSCATWHPG